MNKRIEVKSVKGVKETEEGTIVIKIIRAQS